MVTPGGKNLNFKKLSERKWYNGAVIACIGVGFYVLLTNLGTVIGGIGAFLSNFKTVFLGIVFAYVMNPLAKFFYYRLFKWMKLGKTRWILSVVLSLLMTLAALLLLLGMLIPQLAESITRFSENYESYAAALTRSRTLCARTPGPSSAGLPIPASRSCPRPSRRSSRSTCC